MSPPLYTGASTRKLLGGKTDDYRIAGNFGEVFNLAIWRILKKIAKLKLANI